MSDAPSAGIVPRRLALDLLNGVLIDGQMLSDVEASPALERAKPEDRARAGRLARATLRLGARADAAMRPFLRRTPAPEVHHLMRLAVVEILSEGAAPHGVVNAAVSIARKTRASSAPMVNAILRRVTDDETGLNAWTNTQPQRLPGWLRGRLGSAYGNARVALMEKAQEQGAPLDLSLRDPAEAQDLAEALGAEILPTGSLRLASAGQVTTMPGFGEGAWWVQDAAAALPAQILNAQPGEKVLDLCAAPGGKTLQLAARGADVTAVDISGPRLERLRENLERTELKADVITADALNWEPEGAFDAILLDAPCSATGTIRRHPDLPFVKDSAGIKSLIPLQAALADKAVQMLAPNGRLILCTCSLLPEEGEALLAGLMERHPTLRPDPEALSAMTWIEDGWRHGDCALRLTPDFWADRGGLDGFFIAALRKAV